MASKRTARTTKLVKSKDYNALVLHDILCPICRSILIEPVSLPCSHDFCLFCFEGTMENANLVCPLCRLRIGSWLRKVRKDNKLINGELWKAIKGRFPQHVKNKLNGVDENIEEKREIIVAYPGEIRKEYEIQKQKEEAEQNRKRDIEIKASEALIQKLKEEEDYQKAVIEEKMKLDEEVAKKLAEELMSKHPSTSKSKPVHKKLGPMDKFVTKENAGTTLNQNNFMNKEYTCRVLCLDSGKRSRHTSASESSPKIHKKIPQIQKIADLEATSDGSDCIESEMRYFKPIDYRLNPPTHRRPPVKVTPKKLLKDGPAKILSPGGVINFCSNILESAFARFSIEMPKLATISNTSPVPSIQSCTQQGSEMKRKLSSSDFETPDKRIKQEEEESPVLNYGLSSLARKKLFGNGVMASEASSESPPFYGFDRKKRTNVNLVKNVRKNGSFVSDTLDARRRREQEAADLEFAKKLQEEFDKSHYTRSSRSLGTSKKQKTIDDMIKSPYRVK